jgi:hypothetical protein
MTVDRVAMLEQKLTRLRRDVDRMARVMALLEHDLAIERIAAARPTLFDRFCVWLSQLAAQLSPWPPRTGPRLQRPLV